MKLVGWPYSLFSRLLQICTNFGLVLFVDDQTGRSIIEDLAITLAHVLKIVGHASLACN